MSLPGKTHLYVAVLGVCGLALLVDRFFLGSPIAGPAAAQAGGDAPGAPASGASVSGSVAPRGPGAPAEGLGLSIPELPFPRDLPALARGTRLRDLFSRPKTRLHHDGADEPSAADDGSVDADTQDDDPSVRTKQFAERHRLDAVLVDSGLRIAVVDGAWVSVGDKVDGCELVTIDGSQATFRCSDRETSLAMSPLTASAPH